MIIHGLQPLPADERDLKHDVVFGSIFLPEEYCIPNMKVKDQGNSDLCSAFSTSSASEVQEGVELSPEYAFAKGKEISGNPKVWGNDLRTAAKAHVKYGCIEAKQSPYNILKDDRDVIANYESWNMELDYDAIFHAKKSYFSVNNTMEAIKQAIYQNKMPVVTGALWRMTWTYSPGGIIPTEYERDGFGHAFLWKGWKRLDGKEYLIAHLSNGTNIGDRGCFYFPKEVVEKECTFGNFVFTDLSKETAQYYHDNKIQVQMNWLEQMYAILKNLLASIAKK